MVLTTSYLFFLESFVGKYNQLNTVFNVRTILQLIYKDCLLGQEILLIVG